MNKYEKLAHVYKHINDAIDKLCEIRDELNIKNSQHDYCSYNIEDAKDVLYDAIEFADQLERNLNNYDDESESE